MGWQLSGIIYKKKRVALEPIPGPVIVIEVPVVDPEMKQDKNVIKAGGLMSSTFRPLSTTSFIWKKKRST